MRVSKNSPHPRVKTQRIFVPTREWLVGHYVEKDMTSSQIREITGYSKNGFNRLLKVYGIEPKGRSLPKLEISRETLYQLHVVEGLTAVKIAARLGCHNSLISRLIKTYELDPERPLVNIPTQPPLTRDELWKLYWVDELSAGTIGERYSAARSTVLRWMTIYDIPRRKWNGGDTNNRVYVRNPSAKNRYGREFNAQERESIFKRDGRQCRMPGCHETQWLEAHHIVPVLYGGTNETQNGLTLCAKCHKSIMRKELEFVGLFQGIVKELMQSQTCYIGETPEEDNTEGTC